MLKALWKMRMPKEMLDAVSDAIRTIQANGFDLAFNLKKGVYEVVEKGDAGNVFETFDDYQKIIDYAETLPIRRINDVKVNLN